MSAAKEDELREGNHYWNGTSILGLYVLHSGGVNRDIISNDEEAPLTLQAQNDATTNSNYVATRGMAPGRRVHQCWSPSFSGGVWWMRRSG